MERRRRVAAVAASLALVLLFAACSSSSTGPATSADQSGGLPTPKGKGRTAGDTEVSFDSGGVTVRGSLRMPAGAGLVPAAVILAGSGPTDRDGNSTLVPGEIGTLSFLAKQLEADGVASLRYDKLGAGKTGLGPYATKPNEIDFNVFVQEARDALTFLAAQPDIDTTKLLLVGHSEGGLIALVASVDPRGAPGATGLVLVNPVPMRYLDLLAAQIRPKADTNTMVLAQRAIDAVRAGRALPAGLPPALSSLFSPATVTFLRQADQVDPVSLAGTVDPSVKALVVCSDKDIQVPCAPVQALANAFPSDIATFVSLAGTDHVLKEVTASDGTEYTRSLPFSTQMKDELKQFVDRWRG
ncbi:MAG: alpha/beta fold hydrolase [Actinobacteria bacterium]|nr:alpha/beta fold hydrolase [Actinomycetota bacterium]